MLKYSQGIYKVKNPKKYIGQKPPRYRSSWELFFCRFCDNNPAVQQWASESVKIPYRDPLTGKQTIYVPDFLIVYIDKNLRTHAELIEIKPANQTLKERVGRNAYNQAQYVKNQAKWAVAEQWARQQGIRFRVITESDLYVQTGNHNK